MSDDFEPFATAGSGKSDPEVAFDLLSKLKGQGIWGERNITAILDMYAECLDAVKGMRVYEGQDRVIAPVREAGVQSAAVPVPQQTQPAVQPQQAQVQPVPQPQQVQQANPVQAQQQHLQQQIQKQA